MSLFTNLHSAYDDKFKIQRRVLQHCVHDHVDLRCMDCNSGSLLNGIALRLLFIE